MWFERHVWLKLQASLLSVEDLKRSADFTCICSFPTRWLWVLSVWYISSSHNHMYAETWKSSSSFSRSSESTEQPQPPRKWDSLHFQALEAVFIYIYISGEFQWYRSTTSRNVWIIQSFSCCTLQTMWDWFMGVSSASPASFQSSCMLADVSKCGRDMGICDSFYCISLLVVEGWFGHLLIQVPVVLIPHVMAQMNVFTFKSINFADLKTMEV